MAGRRDERAMASATVKITNYCREIIEALNREEPNEVLKLFNSFYKKIPSTLKKHPTKHKDANFDS